MSPGGFPFLWVDAALMLGHWRSAPSDPAVGCTFVADLMISVPMINDVWVLLIAGSKVICAVTSVCDPEMRRMRGVCLFGLYKIVGAGVVSLRIQVWTICWRGITPRCFLAA
ncbi:hypothetical protein BDV59DRAFT_106725 [Aspergillus ambiguus]|uniref:uncharacterized protein n=1 Tax=Aspergillus ambiguus TaxID=176160 RepID=UPI003CCD4D2D